MSNDPYLILEGGRRKELASRRAREASEDERRLASPTTASAAVALPADATVDSSGAAKTSFALAAGSKMAVSAAAGPPRKPEARAVEEDEGVDDHAGSSKEAAPIGAAKIGGRPVPLIRGNGGAESVPSSAATVAENRAEAPSCDDVDGGLERRQEPARAAEGWKNGDSTKNVAGVAVSEREREGFGTRSFSIGQSI